MDLEWTSRNGLQVPIPCADRSAETHPQASVLDPDETIRLSFADSHRAAPRENPIDCPNARWNRVRLVVVAAVSPKGEAPWTRRRHQPNRDGVVRILDFARCYEDPGAGHLLTRDPDWIGHVATCAIPHASSGYLGAVTPASAIKNRPARGQNTMGHA